MANLGGQEGSGKRIFFAWLNGQVGQEGQELDLHKFPRTSPEGSEDRLGELAGGRREGPALEGPGAWGGGGPSPRGWEGGQRALPPGGAPSCCGSDVVLRARAPGSRGILATALHRRGWGQLKGITLHPVSASGQEPPPPTPSPAAMILPDKTNANLSPSATQKAPILLQPDSQRIQDRTPGLCPLVLSYEPTCRM